MNVQGLIKEIVEKEYNLKLNDKSRQAKYVEARAIYYKLTRKYSFLSLDAIGKNVGRDHACVINGINRLDGWLTYDKVVINMYNSLKNEVSLAVFNLNKDSDYKNLEELFEYKYNKLLNEYKMLDWKHNFIKKRLSRYEPNTVFNFNNEDKTVTETELKSLESNAI